VTFDTPLKLRAGGTYWIRHCYYEMPAIDVSEGSNILLEGIVIYSMPGMGWIMHGDLDHWTVRNCRLEIPEGSKRPMSTAADGLHVSGSRGYFLMDNCQIGNCGDDCVNIHDNCAQGVDRIDDHTIKVHSVGWRMSLAAGNAIELFRGDYSPLGYKSQIVEISHQGADATIKFADSLPVDVPADAIVWNHSRQTSNVHITGCVFHDNIGRGILLSAADATVDHCVFDHTASRGFQFHTELEPPHWWEGHGASNILFTNNRIVDTNLIGRDGGAPIFAKPNLPGGPTSVPIFHDILIADNEIVDSLGPSLELESCKNLIVEANRIRNKRNFARFSPQSSAITIRRSSNIVVFDNTWSGPYCTRPGVEYDPATTAGIVEHGNEIVR